MTKYLFISRSYVINYCDDDDLLDDTGAAWAVAEMSQYLFKHFSLPGITPAACENSQHMMGLLMMMMVMVVGMTELVMMMTVAGGWKYTPNHLFPYTVLLLSFSPQCFLRSIMSVLDDTFCILITVAMWLAKEKSNRHLNIECLLIEMLRMKDIDRSFLQEYLIKPLQTDLLYTCQLSLNGGEPGRH